MLLENVPPVGAPASGRVRPLPMNVTYLNILSGNAVDGFAKHGKGNGRWPVDELKRLRSRALPENVTIQCQPPPKSTASKVIEKKIEDERTMSRAGSDGGRYLRA